MLQLYNLNKEKIEGLTKYKDLKIESALSTGDKVLSFSYPKKYSSNILEEGYLRTKTAEFVIKQIDKTSDTWINVTASLNVEELESMIEDFDSTEQTIENCINFALAGTGWTVNVDKSITKRRTIRKTNSSIWDIIQQVKKTYIVEIEFDTINKIVIVKEQLGSDRGVYFTEELNLKSLGIQSNSYDFYTRILALGKDDLKVEVENYSYSKKRKTLIWKDERYTNEGSLREDATLKLKELSKPYRTYSADVVDLANLNKKYKDILSYKLGDTITLISKENNIKEKQRIVKTIEYPDNPKDNTVEIANTTLSFEDVQKEFQDTTDTVNNITEDDGTISEGAIKETVKRLTVDKINVQELNAVIIRVGTLEATKANITDLTAINAQIENLKANKIEVTDLTAINIKFEVASGGTLDLQTLLSKFVTGENGQFLNLTTDNVTISNAVIKDIIAKNISVEDLKAGRLSTNKINITSDDGGIIIAGPTMQFKDKSDKVRIQMGQDTKGDFNFILRGEDGATILIDHNGIKEKAIADDLIKENMVAEGAIGEKQINYSSLITGFNKDTNTSLIQASKVAIDLTGQSLEVAFNNLKSNVDGINSTVESNTTAISIAQGKIEGLIKESSITKGDITTLKDNYTSIKATVDGINTTVASHTSSIGNLTSNLNGVSGKITTVENKQSTLEQNLNGFKTTVSSTYATKTALSTANSSISSLQTRMSSAESKITDSAIINTVKSTINQAKNDAINSANNNTTNKLKNYSTTTSMNSAIEQKASSILSTVANTYTTQGTTSSIQSQINQQANIISTKVDSGHVKSVVNQSVDKVRYDFSSSGGNNLLLNSGFRTSDFRYWGIASHNSPVGGHRLINAYNDWGFPDTAVKTAEITLSNQSNVEYGLKQSIPTTIGQKYSVSFYYASHRTSQANLIIRNTSSWLTNKSFNPSQYLGGKYSVGNWGYLTHSFIATETRHSIEIVLNAAQQDGYFWIAKPMVSVGEPMAWQPGQDEIYSGNTTIDASGVTINNGALKVKNKAEQTTIEADSAGNLKMNIYGSKFRIAGTGGRGTNMWTDYYDKFILEVPYYQEGSGIWIKRDTGATIMVDTARKENPFYKIWIAEMVSPAIKANQLYVTGSKNCLQTTKNYGERLINAYETAEYYFGDIGSGIIKNGECIVMLDDILQECINTDIEYHVFTQVYTGNIEKIERYKTYFIVYGKDDTEFSWELKAKRKGYENVRLDTVDNIQHEKIDDPHILLDKETEENNSLNIEELLLEETEGRI